MSIQAINVLNQFRGKVKEIIRGDVVSEVDVGAFRALSATFALAIALAVAVGARRNG